MAAKRKTIKITNASEKREELHVVPEYATTTAVAQILGKSVRRIQQLTQDGVLVTETPPWGGKKKYPLAKTVQAYIRSLEDKASEKSGGVSKSELELRKLEVEIDLKESQGELHKLKTAIAEGKYIAVEDVKLDYQRFFVQLKRFLLAVPNRVGGMISGYLDPVELRGVEKDMSREVTNMLNQFIIAGNRGDE